ncbi:MAG TPA: cytochrome c [Thermoanaerobaculia bacterium]
MRRVLLVVLALSALACTRGSTSSRPPIHLNPNMDDQPRYEAQAASDFFADGMAARAPVPGTVARGELADDPGLQTGATADGTPLAFVPIPVDERFLARGTDRYAIYCGPCHADDGSGQSMLRQRSGVATADLTQERLRQATDGYLFDVITNGFGLMGPYAYQLAPRDRWAVVAHVRRLQAQAGPATVEVEAPAEATVGGAPPSGEDAAGEAPAEDGGDTP